MFLLTHSPLLTGSDGVPLFEVAVLGTVPPYVSHVPALEAASVLRLPLVLLGVLVFLVFLLLHPEGKNGENKKTNKNLQCVRVRVQNFALWTDTKCLFYCEKNF